MENTETVEIQHPNARNAVYLADGRIDCEIEHSTYGWMPTTIDNNENPEFFDHVVNTQDIKAYEPPAPPSHIEQREEALYKVDQEHAKFLRTLTGNATIEERDTWKTKEEAARAFVNNSASDGQKAMIAYEAQGDKTDLIDLAKSIIVKAEGFQALIGLAAGMKAKAKTAIYQITNEQIPIENVSPGLVQLFEQMSIETDAAVQQWKSKS